MRITKRFPTNFNQTLDTQTKAGYNSRHIYTNGKDLTVKPEGDQAVPFTNQPIRRILKAWISSFEFPSSTLKTFKRVERERNKQTGPHPVISCGAAGSDYPALVPCPGIRSVDASRACRERWPDDTNFTGSNGRRTSCRGRGPEPLFVGRLGDGYGGEQ